MNNKSILCSLQLLLLITLAAGQAMTPSLRRRLNMFPTKQSKIIGGVNVNNEDRYPYYALMNGSHMCGAVLISRRFVLTAAHCVGADDDFQFGITDLNFHSTSNGGSTHDEYIYTSKLVHPDYNHTTVENDIAIYELQQDVPDSVQYLRLQPDSIVVPETPLTVIGFGDTDPSEFDELINTLLKTTVHYVSQTECKDRICDHLLADYDISQETCVDYEILTDAMMCAYSEGTDSCQGDSGGPLILEGSSGDASEDTLVGLVSWGFDCAGESPGVYTRISHLYDWIITSMCQMNPDGVPEYVDCSDIETLSPDDFRASESKDSEDGDAGHFINIWDSFTNWLTGFF